MTLSRVILAFVSVFCVNGLPMEEADLHPAFRWLNTPEAKSYFRTVTSPSDRVVAVTFDQEDEGQPAIEIALSKLENLSELLKALREVQDSSTTIALKMPRKTFQFMCYAYYLEHEMGCKNNIAMFTEPISKTLRKQLLSSCEPFDSAPAVHALLSTSQLDYVGLIKNLNAMQAAINRQSKEMPEDKEQLNNKQQLLLNQAVIFKELILGDPLDPHHEQLLKDIHDKKLGLLLPYQMNRSTLAFLKKSALAREVIVQLLNDIFWEELLYQKFGYC